MTARTQTGPLSSQQGLTERQLASWRSDGYLILRRAFDGRTMHAVEHWTEQLAAAPELPGRHMVYHELSLLAPDRPLIQRIENFYPYHEGLRDLIDGPALLGQVETLFGEPPSFSRTRSTSSSPAVMVSSRIRISRRGGQFMQNFSLLRLSRSTLPRSKMAASSSSRAITDAASSASYGSPSPKPRRAV